MVCWGKYKFSSTDGQTGFLRRLHLSACFQEIYQNSLSLITSLGKKNSLNEKLCWGSIVKRCFSLQNIIIYSQWIQANLKIRCLLFWLVPPNLRQGNGFSLWVYSRIWQFLQNCQLLPWPKTRQMVKLWWWSHWLWSSRTTCRFVRKWSNTALWEVVEDEDDEELIKLKCWYNDVEKGWLSFKWDGNWNALYSKESDACSYELVELDV